MEHDHHHHHHHHHAEAAELASLRGIYWISIALNLTFVFVEAGIGLWKDSLGLLSDAGHNLSDVFSLILAMIAFRLATTQGSKKFTYGYRKGSILISLLNAVILLVAVGAILVESIHKLRHPASIDGGAVAWTAGIGIIVNGLTALLLMKHQKNDINTQYQHESKPNSRLSNMYFTGMGVEQSNEKAAEYFRLSAAQNNPIIAFLPFIFNLMLERQLPLILSINANSCLFNGYIAE